MAGQRHLKILCGGEALSSELADQLLTRSSTLWNMYGPTESTIWSSIYRVDTPNGQIPIGRPIANTQVYILDRNQQVLPIGVPGELYIGGDGLAQGYLNRPELTDENFIPHPFSSDKRKRLYKTGDLARWLSDGNMRFSAGWTIRSRSVVFASSSERSRRLWLSTPVSERLRCWRGRTQQKSTMRTKMENPELILSRVEVSKIQKRISVWWPTLSL